MRISKASWAGRAATCKIISRYGELSVNFDKAGRYGERRTLLDKAEHNSDNILFPNVFINDILSQSEPLVLAPAWVRFQLPRVVVITK